MRAKRARELRRAMDALGATGSEVRRIRRGRAPGPQLMRGSGPLPTAPVTEGLIDRAVSAARERTRKADER